MRRMLGGMGEGSGIPDLSRRGFFKLCFVAVAPPLLAAAGCGGEEDDEGEYEGEDDD